MKIKFIYIHDLIKFVRLCSTNITTVYVTQGNICVDGSSLLGLLTLDLTSQIIVKSDRLNKEITDFLAQLPEA